MLRAYALIAFERHQHGTELGALVHQPEHIAGPEQRLIDIVRGLLAESQDVGAIRGDVPPDELATLCLHALEAARAMSSKSAVQRLVTVVLDGLRYRV